MTIDIDQVRAETPGVRHRVHLNNAGASMMPAPVLRAVEEFVNLEAEIGGYEAAAREGEAARRLYPALASLAGCNETQIAFADSGTRAWNAILYAVSLSPGDIVVTTQPEFGSNVVSLMQHCSRSGAELRVVRCGSDGTLDIADLEQKLSDNVRLIAATHVAAHRGYVAPVAELARAAAERDAFFLLDGAQSVGQLPIDFGSLGCHALTGTARKWLRGARGAAFLVIAEELPGFVDPTSVDLASADFLGTAEHPVRVEIRGDARRFELWERSVAAAIGLGRAVDYLLDLDPYAASARIAANGRALAERLRAVDGPYKVLADPGGQSGIVGLQFPNDDTPGALKEELARNGINVSAMAEYDAPWDYQALGATSLLRVAPHYFTTSEDLDRFMACFARALR